MQRILLKLRFHQWNLLQPHLAPQPKSTGLAGATVSMLEAFASHVPSIKDHTSSHPKSPEPQQQKEYHSPCLNCALPFEVSPAQLRKGCDFFFFQPDKTMAVGPSGAVELPQRNFAMMVYNVRVDFHWLCYHTAVSLVTAIAVVSSNMHI